jgi:hypothetical protein
MGNALTTLTHTNLSDLVLEAFIGAMAPIRAFSVNASPAPAERGDKVKVSVRLKGRERDHPERARELIEKLLKMVTTPNRSSKMDGPVAMAMIEPGSVKL